MGAWNPFLRKMVALFRHTRISLRITLLYAAILCVVLFVTSAITGIGVYFSFYHQAEIEMEISIRRTLEQVAKGRLFETDFWRNDPLLPGVVLRVTDLSGRIVLENDARYPSIETVERNLREHPPLLANPRMGVADFRNMSIYYAKVPVMQRGQLYELHFFKTITAEKEFLRRLLWVLFITNIIGFLIALAAGFLVSRRILQPIRSLTRMARRIEVERMDSRIPLPSRRDELTDLAETFNRMLDRLQNGFKQQQQFVSDASHELRTPVTVILGYSDLLSRWGREDPEVLDEGISSIRSEAENMQQLIEKLLFLARADQKRQVLHKEPLEFSEVVADVMKKMKLVDKEHEVELRQNDEGNICADQVTIRQMLRIFLENSQKYTPKGGKIYASSRKKGDFFHLVLGDTGIGIAPEEQEKVFERFYRVDTSRTKAAGGAGGTGLGLSIARWIAEQHDIKISLKSDLGKGTEVHLEIPLAGVKAEDLAMPEQASDQPEHGFWEQLRKFWQTFRREKYNEAEDVPHFRK